MPLHIAQSLLETDLQEFEQLIANTVQSEVKLVNDLVSHIMSSGGKRIRPILVLLAAKICQAPSLAATRLAAVVEFIHTATLLHDDVIDNSSLRRSHPTANALWGNKAAILVGDFLYSKSFQLMVAINDLKVMEVLANASNKIAEGEVLQLTHLNNSEVSEASYYQVIHCKTATLFAAATGLGAIIGQQAKHFDALNTYGEHLGIAFQLLDDLLDYQSHAKHMGKNPGDDLLEGKPTLPLIYLLQHGNSAEKSMACDALKQNSLEKFTEIQAALQRVGAFAYTQAAIQKQIGLAQAALKDLPDSPYKDAAMGLAQYAGNREI